MSAPNSTSYVVRSDALVTDPAVQVVDEGKLVVDIVQKAHRDLIEQTRQQILVLEQETNELLQQVLGSEHGAGTSSQRAQRSDDACDAGSVAASGRARRRLHYLHNRLEQLRSELVELEAEQIHELGDLASTDGYRNGEVSFTPTGSPDALASQQLARTLEAGHALGTEAAMELAPGLWLPRSLYERLFPYQKEGLVWLWSLHVQGTGGILGDEMGLGKTVQIIAFLAALDYSGLLKGPILVVAPVTVLDQWRRELETWWPRLQVRVLHAVLGIGESALQPNQCPSQVIFITNYEHLRIHASWFTSRRWDYVILDEGHRIRNPEAEVTRVCKQLNTVHRILMTGAPLQNRLCELWSLFDFIYPGRLGTLQSFEEEFSIPISLGGFANATPAQVHIAYRCASTLRDLIAPYLLRRLKRDVALQLPQKQEHVLLCRLTPEQRRIYQNYLNAIDVERAADGQLNLLPIITTLRKICNHPRLAAADLHVSGSERKLLRQSTSGKLLALDRLLHQLRETNHRALIFSQTRSMLTLLEKTLNKGQFTYLRMDGETNVALRAELVDRFNHDSSIFAFLLTTRVGGLGLNLIGADRVIIYDPDWNPASDTQARERAWRIGQERPVVVYRLLTRGTIEEKIYHRQIFKTFLSEKVLHDPRKRRFFKRKDIHELLTLHEDATDEDFVQVQATARESLAPVSVAAAAGDDADADNHCKLDAKQNEQLTAEMRIMRQLLDGNDARALDQVAAVFNHDSTLEVSGKHPRTAFDRQVLQAEADRVAQRALAALRRSLNHQTPTTPLPEPTTQAPWLCSTAAANRAPSSKLASQALLQCLHEREAVDDDEEQVRKLQSLVHEITSYLQRCGPGATTAELAGAFKSSLRVRGINAAEFRAVLKLVAYLSESGDGNRAVWRLRASALLPDTSPET